MEEKKVKKSFQELLNEAVKNKREAGPAKQISFTRSELIEIKKRFDKGEFDTK